MLLGNGLGASCGPLNEAEGKQTLALTGLRRMLFKGNLTASPPLASVPCVLGELLISNSM